MSNKGKVFTAADLGPRRRALLESGAPEQSAQIQAWLDAQTERWQIVGHVDGEPVIAEELTERLLQLNAAGGPDFPGGQIDPDVLAASRLLAALPRGKCAQVLAAFDADGAVNTCALETQMSGGVVIAQTRAKKRK